MYLVVAKKWHKGEKKKSKIWEYQEFEWSKHFYFLVNQFVLLLFIMCSLCVHDTYISPSQWRISDTKLIQSYLCQWRHRGLDQALSVFRHSVWKCRRQLLQIKQWKQISSAVSHHMTSQHCGTIIPSTFHHIQNPFHSSEIIYNSLFERASLNWLWD